MGKWLGKFSVPKRGYRKGQGGLGGGSEDVFAAGSFSSLRPLSPCEGDRRDPSGDLGENKGENDGR
eukprot:4967416-Pyramimonas_sp.AAC.1